MAGLAVGLVVSPLWPSTYGLLQAVFLLALIVLAALRHGRVSLRGACAIAAAAVLVGLSLGSARLDSISSGALKLEPGSQVELTGITTSAPRHSRGLTRFVVQTKAGKIPAGKLLFESPDTADGVSVGEEVRTSGTVSGAPDWMAGQLTRQGVAMVLYTDRIDLTGKRRGGVAGWIDGLRVRAEAALEVGMPERESSLARGFVLGQDDSIDELTVAEFQNSGLAHLLAVSGQNVVLLGLLMAPILALTGIGLRSRLVVIVAVILIYIPLAGGGASIQRAGAMGIAALVATAASRPSSRLYGLLVAVVVTLGLNPLATTDIGWQLSFAAVLGIFLLGGPLSRRLRPEDSPDGGPGWRMALADAAAITVAATVATAPLMAFHFEQIPVATLVANLLAAPAIAPAMWLGMISAAVGQLDPALALPFNAINSVLLAYVAQVAHWFGSPGWAVIKVNVDGPMVLVGIYIALGLLVLALLVATGTDAPVASRRRARASALLVVAAALAVLVVAGGSDRRGLDGPESGGARIEIFDVGQGDAILLRPDRGDPVLIDGGPPDGDVTGALESAGVDDLSAVVLTHNHLDHFGGLFDVVEQFDPEQFMFDHAPADLLSAARSSGTATVRVSAGDSLDFNDLELEILWPPDKTGVPSAVDEDPNSRSIAGLLKWHQFRMLLTGDAEADMAPLDPGPLDVLKVAHHGSEDTGLTGLLARTSPDLAVISVGEDNGYGHPDLSTLDTLDGAGIPVLRTDEDGTVSILLGRDGLKTESGR